MKTRSVGFGTLVALVVASFAPVGGAQDTPPLLAQGQTAHGLYVTGDALGGELSPTPPPEGTAVKKSLIASAINPALGTTVVLGTFTPAVDLTFTSDVAASVYLVANTAMAYDQIQLNLVGGGLTGSSAFTPLTAPGAVQTTPFNLRLGVPTMGQTVAAGAKVTFQALLFGASAAGTPTELFLLYGSAASPSGLTFSASSPGAFPPIGSTVAAFLAEKSLTPDTPAQTADKSSTISGSSCTGTCFGSVPAWTWGKMPSTGAFTAAGPSVLTVWVAPPGGAGAMRGFSATLSIGKTNFAASQGTIAKTWSSAAATKYVFVFATTGAEILADDEIGVGFQAWTTADAADVKVFYGSTAKPAGVMIPVLGGAAPSASVLNVTVNPPSPTGPAGGSANGALTLANPGLDAVNATLNITGELPFVFDVPPPYAVGGGNSSTLNFTIDLSATLVGTYNVTVQAMVEGVEAGNATFVVTVTEPVPSSSAAASNTTASTNTTASPAAASDEGGGIPGPGAAASLLAVGALATVRRYRRR